MLMSAFRPFFPSDAFAYMPGRLSSGYTPNAPQRRRQGQEYHAPPEQLAYVVAFDRAAQQPDALAVLGTDPGSAGYGRVVGWADLPGRGNELHHFGWNACSSAFAHAGHTAGGLQRRYLLIPGIRSPNIHVCDIQPDPRQSCSWNISRVVCWQCGTGACTDGRITMLSKKEAAEAVRAAKAGLGVTWSQLAEAVGRPVAWTTSALLGQQPMTAAQAKAACSLLELGEDVLQALQLQPTRGALETPVPADPTIYRFYEVLQVYGPTVKELIHEEFGDGIMSAINFRLEVRREPDPGGDRVVVVLDGKFLPYQW
jgi:cyanate lyase